MTGSRREFMGAATVAVAGANRVLGASDRIGVGMIGCGGRGLLKEVLQFTGETNAEVVAVCDTWKQQREKAVAAVRESSGREPEQYVRYHELLANKKVDAVVIGTPDHQHCTMLVAAIRAGKDVYIEKPLAMDMKELNLAVETVKKSDRVVQMGTQVRSWAPSVAGRAFVQSGGLGRIFKIEQSRNSYRPYWHSYGERPIKEEDVDWKGFLMMRKARPFNARQYAGWYGYREFSRGPHTNLMVHFIDLLHYVTGAKLPSKVTAMGGIYRWKDDTTAPDSVEVALEYPEGFLVRYTSVFGTGQNSFMKFFGERGVMDATSWSKPWLLTPEKGNPGQLAAGTPPEVSATHHMLNFLECVRSRKTPHAPIDAGYAHSVAVMMADEAMMRGTRMDYNQSKRAIQAG